MWEQFSLLLEKSLCGSQLIGETNLEVGGNPRTLEQTFRLANSFS